MLGPRPPAAAAAAAAATAAAAASTAAAAAATASGVVRSGGGGRRAIACTTARHTTAFAATASASAATTSVANSSAASGAGRRRQRHIPQQHLRVGWSRSEHHSPGCTCPPDGSPSVSVCCGWVRGEDSNLDDSRRLTRFRCRVQSSCAVDSPSATTRVQSLPLGHLPTAYLPPYLPDGRAQAVREPLESRQRAFREPLDQRPSRRLGAGRSRPARRSTAPKRAVREPSEPSESR